MSHSPGQHVPGQKWFAAYEPSDAAVGVAASVLADRLGRVRSAMQNAGDQHSAKAVRKLRVATRRADAAVRFAEPLAGERQTGRLRRRLRLIRRAAGAVRRSDVFAARLAPLITTPSAVELAPAAAAVLGVLAAQRRQAAGEFARLLERARAKPLAFDLLPVDGVTVESLALGVLGRAAAEVTQGQAAADPVALHDLRIRAKRLRYAAEVAAPVIGPTHAAGIIAAIVQLQDELGAVNDLAELAELLLDSAGMVTHLPTPGPVLAGLERLYFAASRERDRRAQACYAACPGAVRAIALALEPVLHPRAMVIPFAPFRTVTA